MIYQMAASLFHRQLSVMFLPMPEEEGSSRLGSDDWNLYLHVMIGNMRGGRCGLRWQFACDRPLVLCLQAGASGSRVKGLAVGRCDRREVASRQSRA